MWWSDARATLGRRLRPGLAALALLALTACGFQPLYGRGGPDGGTALDDLAAVRINPLPDRVGQQFHNLLRDRLNPAGQPVAPAFDIDITLREYTQGVGIRKDETATRANLVMSAVFVLREAGTQNILQQGTSNSIISYNILESQFATKVSEDDARRRGLRELSEDIRLRLATYFSRRREGGKT